MRRALVVLGILVLALGSLELWLDARQERARQGERKVGRLFTLEEAADLRKQPALRIEGNGEAHAYGRIQGQWRCLSYHQAPCDGSAIQALLDGMVGAEGIVHADAIEVASTFGINTPRTLRVSIQGPRATQDPGGDVLAMLEIGEAQGGREACFVRRKGTREIWSIAQDLRAPLEGRVAPGLPPFLEPSVVPEGRLQPGLARITLEQGAERRAIVRRERELDPSQMKPGQLPWKWALAADELDEGVDPREVSASFVAFLERLPYVEVLDTARRESLGFDAPRARITLETPEGPPLVLAFGAVDLPGGVPLWVEGTETLYRVEPRVLTLALPESSLLLAPPGEEDPWAEALRSAPR